MAIIPLHRTAILLLLLALGCSKSPLSDAQMRAAAKQQADTCGQAMLRGDYDTFTSFIYPKALDMLGGKDAMVKMIQKERADMASQSFSFKSATVGDIKDIRSSNGDIFAVVPERIEMNAPGGIAQSDSYLLGISNDGGRNWKFIDGAGILQLGSKLTDTIPNFPADLHLPPHTEPVFTADTKP